ncbi:MAG: type I restriction endonuclease subunit M, partial [Thermotogaceae bacterium]|nr:type I restriction endonuclease subunit M [Thermotogaceae bacterium]
DYWDEEMKDDVYMIIENGWEAKPSRIIEKNKRGKEIDKGWTCDILPKEIVIKEFFNQEKEEIDELEARIEDLESQMKDLEDEHSGEEGILEEVKNEKGNITKKDLQTKINELRWTPNEFKEELEVLEKYLQLMDEQTKIKKKIKQKEKELDEKLLRKYYDLTEEDVKRLIVEKKWLERLEENIHDELDNIILNLTSRIKELAERYAKPLPHIEQEVEDYEQRVKNHLKVMGFNL